MTLAIVFWGTPEYAVPSLAALHAAGHRIVAVVTQPDRPAGRSLQLAPPPVKAAALALGLSPENIFQPESTRDPALVAALQARPADLYCIVAYGGLLTKRLLALPRLYCLNAHGSLLPKYRGASPVQAAILNGDPVTGITLMQMVRALDAGPAALRRELVIGPRETGGELLDRLARLSADLFIEGVAAAEAGTLVFTPQDDALATYTRKIERADAAFAWTEPAVAIERKVRAYAPWPGVKAVFLATEPGKPGKRHTVTLIETALEPAVSGALPGAVAGGTPRDGLAVGCGDHQALRILRIKPEGKAAMTTNDWLRGVRGALSTLPSGKPA